MCNICKDKSKKDLCPECISVYNCAKTKKGELNQPSSNNVPQTNRPSQTDLTALIDNDNVGNHDDSQDHSSNVSAFTASAVDTVVPDLQKKAKTYAKKSRQNDRN